VVRLGFVVKACHISATTGHYAGRATGPQRPGPQGDST
jgi:hypothetical protein